MGGVKRHQKHPLIDTFHGLWVLWGGHFWTSFLITFLKHQKWGFKNFFLWNFFSSFFHKIFFINFFIKIFCPKMLSLSDRYRPLFIVLVLRYLLAKCVGGLSNAKPSYTFQTFLPLKFFSEIFVSDHIFRKIIHNIFIFLGEIFSKLLTFIFIFFL